MLKHLKLFTLVKHAGKAGNVWLQKLLMSVKISRESQLNLRDLFVQWDYVLKRYVYDKEYF